MATSRRTPIARAGQPQPGGDARGAGRDSGTAQGRTGDTPRLPPVRLAPREELAAAARVAPLLRAARDLARWSRGRPGLRAGGALHPVAAAAAAGDLELSPGEVDAAWRVATGTGMVAQPEAGSPAESPGGPAAGAGQPEAGRAAAAADVLASGNSDEVLTAWRGALDVMLAAEDLDGLATALYTVGGPVRMEGLFDAYAAAAGTARKAGEAGPAACHDDAAALSLALEALADLGVVELGTDESAGGLTVALSPLGVWGVHRRLRSQGWHVPVLGGGGRDGAPALLATLASCDAEDGEAEIAAWLVARPAARAAAELIQAARRGSPGLRGAAFAVLDRIGADAVPAVTSALAEPVLRAHAAVWLHEHGEQAELGPEDRTWLLVDLGAGLLEEADPRDVVAELLPNLPPHAQAEIVAGLWQVDHPGVTGLLTALSDHHPDASVARAARKAAFKARSPSAGPGASIHRLDG